MRQQLVDVFTDLHFSYFSWHEPGIVMGVVFWMHGVCSPYGRLQPLECAQYVSCTPCPHCVDARLRCSATLECDDFERSSHLKRAVAASLQIGLVVFQAFCVIQAVIRSCY